MNKKFINFSDKIRAEKNDRIASEIYDMFSREGPRHIMRVPASHYSFTLSHFRKANLFLTTILLSIENN